jgi:nicotinamide mononucleotide transporter
MWHTDWIEILGFITGALCVWLLARENIWNWPIGIANNIFYIVVFVRSGLFGDAGLQVVYIVLAAYGWWTWAHPDGTKPDVPVTKTTMRQWVWLTAATAIAAVLLRLFLKAYTSSTVPAWDGFTTAISLAATWGQCKKLLESWWLWIAVDLIYIPLYAYKRLDLTAVLYFVFLLLCIGGLRSWSAAMKNKAMTPAYASSSGSSSTP